MQAWELLALDRLSKSMNSWGKAMENFLPRPEADGIVKTQPSKAVHVA